MATSKRISDEPAYVLHRYDWSESSLILEVFTRNYGRLALVAKGVKRPSSSFRPILLPMQPLHLAFGGDAEIRTLKSAEWQGGYVMPSGEALLCGYYVNELLLALLAREDPHPDLFDIYAAVVQVIASSSGAGSAASAGVGSGSGSGAGSGAGAPRGELLQIALRTYEVLLLRCIGLLPQLALETANLSPLQPDVLYTLVPEGGLRPAQAGERAALTGAQWQDLQDALDEKSPFTATLRVCAECMAGLKPQLRTLVHYHCGVKTLRSRQMMIDIQAL